MRKTPRKQGRPILRVGVQEFITFWWVQGVHIDPSDNPLRFFPFRPLLFSNPIKNTLFRYWLQIYQLIRYSTDDNGNQESPISIVSYKVLFIIKPKWERDEPSGRHVPIPSGGVVFCESLHWKGVMNVTLPSPVSSHPTSRFSCHEPPLYHPLSCVGVSERKY